MDHPCQRCGACCAAFRVSFYGGETDDAFGLVPADMVEPVTPHLVAMKGTTAHPVRCVALRGPVGEVSSCVIYALRPSTCREFKASWEHGVHDDRCDLARSRYGLAPLTPDDWR